MPQGKGRTSDPQAPQDSRAARGTQAGPHCAPAAALPAAAQHPAAAITPTSLTECGAQISGEQAQMQQPRQQAVSSAAPPPGPAPHASTASSCQPSHAGAAGGQPQQRQAQQQSGGTVSSSGANGAWPAPLAGLSVLRAAQADRPPPPRAVLPPHAHSVQRARPAPTLLPRPDLPCRPCALRGCHGRRAEPCGQRPGAAADQQGRRRPAAALHCGRGQEAAAGGPAAQGDGGGWWGPACLPSPT